MIRREPDRAVRALGVGVLGAVTALVAACGPRLGAPEMTGCPAQQPAAGTVCEAPLTCTFPAGDGADAGCGPSLQCASFVWVSLGEVCPAPPPSTCPANIPSASAPCKHAGQACTFDVPGTCPGVFVATCSAAGQWALADESPPCDPPPCPAAAPDAGTSCDYPFDCTYTVMPPGCGFSTEDATCVSGVWKVEAPTCSPPAP